VTTAPGRHLTAQTIMTRLRSLGINLLGARNTALQSLAVEVPPPLVAELLGYSYNVAQRHAEIAAQPWAGYVTSRQPPQAPAALARHKRDRRSDNARLLVDHGGLEGAKNSPARVSSRTPRACT